MYTRKILEIYNNYLIQKGGNGLPICYKYDGKVNCYVNNVNTKCKPYENEDLAKYTTYLCNTNTDKGYNKYTCKKDNSNPKYICDYYDVKYQFRLKWKDDSCMIDSTLFALFIYPSEFIFKNIIQYDDFEDGTEERFNNFMITCTKNQKSEIHERIVQIYHSMKVESSKDMCSDLLMLINRCDIYDTNEKQKVDKLIVPFGSVGSIVIEYIMWLHKVPYMITSFRITKGNVFNHNYHITALTPHLPPNYYSSKYNKVETINDINGIDLIFNEVDIYIMLVLLIKADDIHEEIIKAVLPENFEKKDKYNFDDIDKLIPTLKYHKFKLVSLILGTEIHGAVNFIFRNRWYHYDDRNPTIKLLGNFEQMIKHSESYTIVFVYYIKCDEITQ